MQNKLKELMLIAILATLLASFASATLAWAAETSTLSSSVVSDQPVLAPPLEEANITAQQAITDEINDIVGAVYEPATGELIVIGRVLPDGMEPMSYDEVKNNLLVAMRAVHETAYPPSLGTDPLGPAVTIDPIPSDPNADHVVKYFGNITDTYYGYTFFESDRLLKVYTLGKDNLDPDTPFTSSVPGYSSFFDRWVALNDTDITSGISVRWWFTPSLHLQIDPANAQTILFSNTQVILNRELTGDNVTAKSTQAANEFVTHFNANYNLFAVEQHGLNNDALYELPQFYKLYGIAYWSWAENNAALSISGVNGGWLGNHPVVNSTTPLTTPVISRTDAGLSLVVYGGVGTNPPVSETPDTVANLTGAKLLNDRPEPQALIWPFEIEGTPSSSANNQLVAMAYCLSTNLLLNHSFEGGPGSLPWTQSSTGSFELIDNSLSHWGSYSAYLGDYTNASDSILQEVTIPVSAANPRLTYYSLMLSDEPAPLISPNIDAILPPSPFFITRNPSDVRPVLPAAIRRASSMPFNSAPGISPAVANDFLHVEILDTNNNLLQTLQTVSNEDIEGFWQIADFPLDAYIGQTIRIRFRATNNASNHTAFIIDDISLDIDPMCASGAPPPSGNTVFLPIIMKPAITSLYVQNNIGTTLNITINGVGSNSIPATGNPVFWGSFPSGTYSWSATASGFAPLFGTDNFSAGRVDWTFGTGSPVSTSNNKQEKILEEIIE